MDWARAITATSARAATRNPRSAEAVRVQRIFPMSGQIRKRWSPISTARPGKTASLRFITPDGPAREARFKFFLNRNGSLSNTPDGGVHDLFVISGRADAGSCSIKQPDFNHNLALNNVIFRIPTPVFGAGLIENIAEETILSNMNANDWAKSALGISGHVNRDGNDGMITRFGWKAQNKSLETFSGEAYNVEMGVTNEIFQNERASPDEALQGGLPANCRLNPTPEDVSNMTASPDYRSAQRRRAICDVHALLETTDRVDHESGRGGFHQQWQPDL